MKIEIKLHGAEVVREWDFDDKQSTREAIDFLQSMLSAMPIGEAREEDGTKKKTTRRRWTEEERDMVRDLTSRSPQVEIDEMAELLGRTPSAIKSELYRQEEELEELRVKLTGRP